MRKIFVVTDFDGLIYGVYVADKKEDVFKFLKDWDFITTKDIEGTFKVEETLLTKLSSSKNG